MSEDAEDHLTKGAEEENGEGGVSAGSPKKARLDEEAVGQLTEAERRKRRVERFGATGAEEDPERRRKRAERFGLSTPEQEREKKSKRIERFGIVDEKEANKKKREERKQRFGIVKDEEKLELRAKRFGGDDAGKKKQRAERFAATSSSSSSGSPHLTAKVNVPTAQRLGLPIKPNE